MASAIRAIGYDRRKTGLMIENPTRSGVLELRHFLT